MKDLRFKQIIMVLLMGVLSAGVTYAATPKVAQIPITIATGGTYASAVLSERGNIIILNASVSLIDCTSAPTLAISFSDTDTTVSAGANTHVYRYINKTVNVADIAENTLYQQVITESNPVTIYQTKGASPTYTYIRFHFSAAQTTGIKGYFCYEYINTSGF